MAACSWLHRPGSEGQPSLGPARHAWPALFARDDDALFDHYRHTLEALGNEKGTLGLIFGKAQNKFQDPAKLRRVIADLIDKEVADRLPERIRA